MWRLAVAITSLVTVAVALIIRQYPYLLLRVPKVGFLLYAATGGNIPAYFDYAVFPLEDQWTKANDVIIAACGKCGSVWMTNTVHHIRSRGSPPPFRDLYEEVRFPEFVYYPGQPLAERIELLKDQQKRYPFSIFKTHTGIPPIRFRKDVRYVIGVRSPLDMAASLREFLADHEPSFAKLWGGFPVEAGKAMTAEDNVKYEYMLLHDIGIGKSYLDLTVLGLVQTWWKYRKEPNVIFVHYSNRVRDHRGEIKRLSDFLKIDLSEDEITRVEKSTSFVAMKEESDKYNIRQIYEPFKKRGLVPQDMLGLARNSIFLGPSRSGKSELSPSVQEEIYQKVFAACGAAITQYLFEGGEFPNGAELPSNS